MSKHIVIGIVSFLLLHVAIIGSDGYQSYLHSDVQYAFSAPTGSNTATIRPLDDIKAVPFLDEDNLEDILFVLKRTSELEQFKCSNCHTQNNQTEIKKQTSPHKHISLQHGASKQLTCFSCHDKTDRDVLSNSFTKDVSFDSAASLCYQCHSPQYKDWIKGAHGKRVGAWEGDRVIYNCTQCHNPHNPEFDKRIPKAIPKLRGDKK
jgi:nitrate/TMAO reductase-like tetraheme cytochrome c subunit